MKQSTNDKCGNASCTGNVQCSLWSRRSAGTIQSDHHRMHRYLHNRKRQTAYPQGMRTRQARPRPPPFNLQELSVCQDLRSGRWDMPPIRS